MDLGIAGKRVLVTGGSKGTGAAIAKAFVAEQCQVTMVARREEILQKTLASFGGTEQGHCYLAANLREPGEPTRVAKKLLEKGAFDIVVHNVGGALGIKNPFAAVAEWQQVWVFNAGIAIEMNALLIPPMQRQRWGRVIHISSIAGVIGEPLSANGGALPYAAAKAYLNAYTQGLGREVARDNVVVSALLPAAMLSEDKYWDKLSKSNPELVAAFLKQHHPTGRFGKAEEIAAFAVFMASEQASFACGALVTIDGGRI